MECETVSEVTSLPELDSPSSSSSSDEELEDSSS